ncbi:hypothetical protein [Dickeya dadantii]|uniref:hypothetical protein n=1 Tax=Dickeya dadantii TaxID=204038 RepID=UPI001C0BB3C1|nr:hypothetical protein [Dickeya dadantii]QWT40909.1 hypothetical protein KNV89_21810 [Dickeya dadantii]
MAVKTDAKKSVTEPSLFDVFGPNVSKQVKAVNQRAAELSMGDMARIMDQTGCAVKSSWEPEVLTVGQATGLSEGDSYTLHDRLLSHILQRNEMAAADAAYGLASYSFLDNKGYEVNECQSNLWLKSISKLHATDMSLVPVIQSKGIMKIRETMEQVWSNMNHLFDIGVDGRTMTVTVKYNDPKTEVPRSLTLDADVGLTLGASSGDFVHLHESMVVKSGRARGTRKPNLARALQHTATKK